MPPLLIIIKISERQRRRAVIQVAQLRAVAAEAAGAGGGVRAGAALQQELRARGSAGQRDQARLHQPYQEHEG